MDDTSAYNDVYFADQDADHDGTFGEPGDVSCRLVSRDFVACTAATRRDPPGLSFSADAARVVVLGNSSGFRSDAFVWEAATGRAQMVNHARGPEHGVTDVDYTGDVDLDAGGRRSPT